ncbi:hypothetical protein Z517_06805 [Fonsecaea pedrosoi CBS 271.37]|uniref:Beta-lactamase-related domain-containing protein n=1 Tax=Fonsecaea pedrosoi CBS 271.37 TaxID=1442368 RepID=A0A0D2GNN9_9EURO|nr:uncharacterized protein Z517_06805 [Fonsecaea pedrosoi CBS 271.37]KIW80190.1 hypothetical protein Z517_06805 [Fonsecaea pedrosoi CBS 271.37]
MTIRRVDRESQNYLDDDFTAWLNPLLAKQHVPGVSVAVVREDGRIESAGFGLARLPNTPARADTIYPMASTTKAFTAALLGLLIQDDRDADTSVLGEKGWKTPVSRILKDDFKTKSDYVTRTATLEDIAGHRSGIPGHNIPWGPILGRSLRNTTRCLRHLESRDDSFRAVWQYNNLMYGVLGNVVEEVSGREFLDVLQDRILKPLSMKQTWYGIEQLAKAEADGQVDKACIARGYYWKKGGLDDEIHGEDTGYYVPEPYTSIIGCEPAGALVSTVDDFAKWVSSLLESAQPREDDDRTDSLISNTLWKELTTPRIQIVPQPYSSEVTPPKPNDHSTPTGYALGWAVDPYMYPGTLILSHGGGLPGFALGVVLVPNHNFGLVVATNGGMANSVGEAIAKELIGRRLCVSKQQRRNHIEKQKKQEDRSGISDEKSERSNNMCTPMSGHGTASLMIEGTYLNPAYHTVSLVRAAASTCLGVKDPHLEGVKIIRNGEKVPDSVGRPLLITPLGKRGLHFRLLLHQSTKQPYTNKIVYALETLVSHGDLSYDPAPGLPKGYGRQGDAKYPGKPEPVFESSGVKDRGAVVEVVKGDNENELLVAALGLNTKVDEGTDNAARSGKNEGLLYEGWQDDMIWFYKTEEHQGT